MKKKKRKARKIMLCLINLFLSNHLSLQMMTDECGRAISLDRPEERAGHFNMEIRLAIVITITKMIMIITK